MSIAVDVREFQGAMRDYLAMTSKSTKDALNGKARDLALRSAQRTPKSVMTAAEFKRQQTDPELVTARAKAIFDRRGGGRLFSEIRRATEATMAKKRFGKGYMRSGFTKAALKFKNTEASTAASVRLEGQHERTKATAKNATERSLSALFDIEWGAAGGTDASEKQAIVDRPMAQAVRYVVADIQKYIAKKQQQHAKKITASAGRAIMRAFR